MKSHSDFWLILHQLAGELQREADQPEVRIEQLAAVLSSIAPNTKAIYCANLRFVLDVLAELNSNCYLVCNGQRATMSLDGEQSGRRPDARQPA